MLRGGKRVIFLIGGVSGLLCDIGKDFLWLNFPEAHTAKQVSREEIFRKMHEMSDTRKRLNHKIIKGGSKDHEIIMGG